MSVYKITSGLIARYMRAESAAAAAMGAYNAFHLHDVTVQNIGNKSPDIGAAGYNRIVRPPEDVEDYDVIQYIRKTTGKKTGNVNGYYKTRNATPGIVTNPADDEEYNRLFNSV